MLMEHFLCDDVGGKHNVCVMVIYFQIIYYILSTLDHDNFNMKSEKCMFTL